MEENMAKGVGLHIRRIDINGADWFPVWNAGPQLPTELQALCTVENTGRSQYDDWFAVYDEDGNPVK